MKHGPMNPGLLQPASTVDVHMAKAGNDLQCVACHQSRNHKISGHGITVPEVEGVFSCENCHTTQPHIDNRLMSYHLNKHTDHVACQTCHIPVYAKGRPALMRWDWSTAGKDKGESNSKEKSYADKKDFGTQIWKETIKPVYRWYNGKAKRYLLGDPIEEGQATVLTMPDGLRQDPESKISPFKMVTGKQISDALYKILIPPKLWQGYWQDWDWDRAAREGLNLAGLKYSGKYEFVETVSYQGLNHEVLPKERALSCAQCHASLAGEESCARCHQIRPEIDFDALAHEGIDFKDLVKEGHDADSLVGRTDYIDFKALGYAGDPIEVGGRFESLPLISGIRTQGGERQSPESEGDL